MANPQPDEFTQISNELLEALCRMQLSANEGQIFWCIVRKTYGFKKKSDWITLSQFAKATNLDRRIVHRVLTGLEHRNLVVIQRDDKNHIRYGIQKDYEIWKVSSLRMTKAKTVIQRDDKVSSKEMMEVSSNWMNTKENITKETIQKKTLSSSEPQMRDTRLKKPAREATTEAWLRSLGRDLGNWFEKEFWPLYLRKVSKKESIRAIYDINPENGTRERIISALKEQNESDFSKRDVDKIPHPSTWLNAERWNDEPGRVGQPKSRYF